MTSFGEGDIAVASTTVGKMRVLSLTPDSAVFPRLGLTVGVTLHDRDATAGGQTLSLSDYELRDATGELRLAEHTDVLGSLVWVGPRRFVRSSPWSVEHQVRFACDLDLWRLEQIEKRRAGAAPRFWVQLWPVLMSKTAQVFDSEIRPFELRVPREQWLDVYSKIAGSQFDVLEVRYPTGERDRFQRAIERTREARSKIATGEYDAAVGLCRHVLDALTQDLPSGEQEPLKALFEARTDEYRAKEYVGLVSRIRQLTNFAHHEFGTPMRFSRNEATFIVRVTESVLALVGALASER